MSADLDGETDHTAYLVLIQDIFDPLAYDDSLIVFLNSEDVVTYLCPGQLIRTKHQLFNKFVSFNKRIHCWE